jgi:hypothetical protein
LRHNPVVSLIKTPIFMTREYLHRRPDSKYRPEYVEGEAKLKASEVADELRSEGIVLLPGYFKGTQLAKLQADFESATAGKDGGVNTDSLYNEDIMGTLSFLNAALDPYLLEIIGNYYGKHFGLARASAMRINPTPPKREYSFQWHHDARGRQIHVMVLLSDVSEQGQCMTYLRQSQSRYYTHFRGIANTQFDKDVAADPTAPGRITKLVGPAGTVGIFDANGLHSGNRNDKEKRDALTFAYVTWRHFKPIRAHRKDVETLPVPARAVMAFNPKLELVD